MSPQTSTPETRTWHGPNGVRITATQALKRYHEEPDTWIVEGSRKIGNIEHREALAERFDTAEEAIAHFLERMQASAGAQLK